MELPTKLKNILNKSKKQGSNDDLCRTLTLFMKEFGYTPKEMMDMYIPSFLIMLEEWNKQVEKENEGMKTPRGRRR